VRLLLEPKYNVEVNEGNKRREAALLIAASSGHNDIVQLLLDRGANIEAKNEKERQLYSSQFQGD
jgi:ankyrin repeat protein